jgi:Hydroxymethylglutaryl-coenzyme A reductase
MVDIMMTSPPPTLGMRLDALISKVDEMSSFQMYALIVSVTLVWCLFLLGTGNNTNNNNTVKELNKKVDALNVHYPQDALQKKNPYVPTNNNNMTTRMTNNNDDSRNSIDPVKPANNKTKLILPPAVATPVCSDPVVVQKRISSSKSSSSGAAVPPSNLSDLTNEDIAQLVVKNILRDHELEKRLDPFRAVDVRRIACNIKLAALGHGGALANLPSGPSLDYGKVHGANCEIVVGYVPIPVGLVGPLTLNGESIFVPMATTEGCLVASTNRGAKAICEGGGAVAVIVRDGITRAPCIRMPSAKEAAHLKVWCEVPENFAKLKAAFESTTSFGKLKSCSPTIAGKNIYLRLVCFSGDAMG